MKLDVLTTSVATGIRLAVTAVRKPALRRSFHALATVIEHVDEIAEAHTDETRAEAVADAIEDAIGEMPPKMRPTDEEAAQIKAGALALASFFRRVSA